ncbi:MAG: hypothetical protein EP329_13950 [Deltaproteobacteria bacterium]|nr:MAG: hypothetical protein EP329_13950 [Deltaproteobacteria bacterium]
MLKTLITAALTAGLLIAPGLAFAETSPEPAPVTMDAARASIDVVVIHATKDGEVDPALAGLGKTLQRAFKGYEGFAKLDEASASLGEGDAHQLRLVNGRELSFQFVGVDRDGFLQVHIELDGLRSTVRVKDGGTFFQAGRGYKDGMIVLAFRAKLAG